MDRYNRNILIEGFGDEGQAKLKAAKVLVIGAGGLGSPVLLYLAAAGVGTLGIVDDDMVNITNLQRQFLHFTTDLNRSKIVSAREKVASLNPEVKVVTYPYRFTEENAERIILGLVSREEVNALLTSSPEPPGGEYDFIVDCCDNYATKLLINDVCVKLQKPYSHGAVIAMRGEVMTCIPGTACYRCVFETPPEDGILPTSSQDGILGAVAGIVGSIQATETIKFLVGMDGLITNRLLVIDAKTMNFVSLKVKKYNWCMCD